jgi:putative addiction module antidote
MATSVKVTPIGDGSGIVLSQEMLAKLNVEQGGDLEIVEHPRGLLLTQKNEEVDTQMEAARFIMRQNREVLRRLAE